MDNLNVEQIKKALECCFINEDCTGCHFWEKDNRRDDCLQQAVKDALALITSQEQRIKELTADLEAVRKKKSLNTDISLVRIVSRADTVSEMQERLTSFFENDETLAMVEVDAEYINEQIVNVAKEMLEGANEN